MEAVLYGPFEMQIAYVVTSLTDSISVGWLFHHPSVVE